MDETVVEMLKESVPDFNKWRRTNPKHELDLEKASLNNTDLRGVNLKGANLKAASLSGAILWGANFENANLRETDLSEARLRDANLQNADLRGADLTLADLTDANMSGANKDGVIQAGTVFNGTTMPDGAVLTIGIGSVDIMRVSANIVHEIEQPFRYLRDEINSLDRAGDIESKKTRMYNILDDLKDKTTSTVMNEANYLRHEFEIRNNETERRFRAVQARIERENRVLDEKLRREKWNTFGDKKNWSVLAGVVLLLGLTAFLSFLAYRGIVDTKILENALFVVLGFFFSQQVAARSGSQSGQTQEGASDERRVSEGSSS